MVEQKQVFQSFKNEIIKQITYSQKEIRDKRTQTREAQTRLMNSLQRLELARKQLKDLRKFGKDIDLTMEQQVQEIKQLPFVRSVKLTSNGIHIDVGRIEITNRGTNVYIGDFTIIITPQGVDVKNRNPIIVKDDYGEKTYMEHPHIDTDDRSICFGGERSNKINEHFAKFQLKQLVYMVYLFLKTYTEGDYYNPISYWKQDAKRKERKQKVTINTEQQVVAQQITQQVVLGE